MLLIVVIALVVLAMLVVRGLCCLSCYMLLYVVLSCFMLLSTFTLNREYVYSALSSTPNAISYYFSFQHIATRNFRVHKLRDKAGGI